MILMKYDKEKVTRALDIMYYMLCENSLKQSECPDHYNLYEQDGDVREVLELCAQRFGLFICKRDRALYLSAGVSNKVFGMSNAEIKYELGRGFNNTQMYTVFFIMHIVVNEFYEESMTDTHRQKIPKESLLESINSTIKAMEELEDIQAVSEEYKFNFQDIKEFWDSLPPRELRKDCDDEKQRGVGSQLTIVNETIKFMEKHDLVVEHNNAIYPTDRFKAVIAGAYNDPEIRRGLKDMIEELGEVSENA